MRVYQVLVVVNNPHDIDKEYMPVGLFQTYDEAKSLHDAINDKLMMGFGEDSFIDEVFIETLHTGVYNDVLFEHLGFEYIPGKDDQ